MVTCDDTGSRERERLDPALDHASQFPQQKKATDGSHLPGQRWYGFFSHA